MHATGSTPRLVVLDDDPTGTQTVSDLPVVLRPDARTLAEVAARGPGPFWVLTNTRALTEPDAVTLLHGLVRDVRSACGPDARLVLRGDSTLRGHVLAEIDALASPDAVALFVPAFVEQGRVTVDGVHRVTVDGVSVPVGDTEYARDAVFGYHSSNLVDWVRERDPTRPSVSVPLAQLRSQGSSGLRDLLLSAAPRTVVLPDVQTPEDLRVVAAGWTTALDAGRDVVLRCAASLASVVTGSSARQVAVPHVPGPVLVVCGSHTSGATAQLDALLRSRAVATFEVDVGSALAKPSRSSGTDGALAGAMDAALESERVVALSTPRTVAEGAGTVAAGAAVMDEVVDVVARVRAGIGAVVTKGGITSARVARDGLGARTATVRGQVLPGVPLWVVDLPDGSTLIQVVVPGNIGGASTIADVVAGLVGAGAAPPGRTGPTG